MLQAIKHPYGSIVASDPLDTLTALLSCNQVDRTSLAENFVQVCQLSAEEVTPDIVVVIVYLLTLDC